MGHQRKKKFPGEIKKARQVYRWLWFSPLLTIPTAVFIALNSYDWVQSLLCPGGWRSCRYGLVETFTFGIAIMGSALWHLVLLRPARDKQHALVHWHGRQALALAGMRTIVPMGGTIFFALSNEYIGVIVTFFILIIIWSAGTLIGQEEAVRGVCSLARWLGREAELPPKPVKTPAAVRKSVPEDTLQEVDRLVAVIRFSDDRQLRKKALEKCSQKGIVATAFFDDLESSETKVSGSKVDTLIRVIRHSPYRQQRGEAIDELNQLGLIETL